MESFSRTKKNMHLPIRDGIQETKKEFGSLRYDIEDTVCYLDSFEYLMKGLMVQKIKEVRPPKRKGVVDKGSKTRPHPAARSTPDTRKRIREPTVSPEESAAKKPVEKRPKASDKEQEWVQVPLKKDLWMKKEKKPSKRPEKSRFSRPEAVLIKPAEGMSYATILRELKKRVNPDELGTTVQKIKETRSKDVLVELRCGKEGHLASSCTRKPRCFLCAAKEEKPRDDHIPGTMCCAAFWEAAPNRTP